ncbi:ATP-dependent Clp protease proteolytic subunit [Virgibacillus salexigens]|uniref:ATP-dependent Clp protease proteolytic subunit n=2 Tax=Virgibacillus massiliensis TaxID=1462526 RepID=A0A024QBC2_9BACI|nr:ATP-dependent Clp protease proteolytic subunit [Virgibacillus massiliensis]
MKKFWEMKMATDENVGEIYIYGDIESYKFIEEDTTATSFKEDLDGLGDVSSINLYINSPGGSVFEGLAIYNMLKRHKAHVNVQVDALAASISSVIAMAGDTIYMPKNSMLMIHNAWTMAVGNSADLRKMADDLDRISQSSMQSYLEKAGDKLSEDKLKEMLDAETWLSADEAKGLGLADVVLESNQMAASINNDLFANYKNVPKQLQKEEKQAISSQEMAERQRIAEEAKADSEYTKTILGGII